MIHTARALLLLAVMISGGTPAHALSADEMCRAILADIHAYRSTGRPCPCPYSRLRDGRECGNRAAWAKPDGRGPRCYFEDLITPIPPNRRPNPIRQTWPEAPNCVPTS
jgi:hypothetical protein